MSHFFEQKLNIDIGIYDDIGGSAIQQDRQGFCESLDGSKLFIMCDGHGEDGENAALAVVEEVQRIFSNEDMSTKSSNEIITLLITLCEQGNISCKDKLLDLHKSRNNETFETIDGILLTKKMKKWFLVKGGTTCTIVICVGYLLYCAAVGDSTVKVYTPVLVPRELFKRLHIDTAIDGEISELKSELSEGDLTSHCELSESPPLTDPYEYRRIEKLPTPALICYDSKNNNKCACPRIFSINSVGELVKGKRIGYYKNVNSEPASIVVLPSEYDFKLGPDIQLNDTNCALAMSRSLGDFSLKPVGVTEKPIVTILDMKPFFENMQSIDGNPNITIILATDGLWDNMREFETVSDTNQFLQESVNFTRTAQEIATALGNENDRRGRCNFGNTRDNTTIIVAKFTETLSDV